MRFPRRFIRSDTDAEVLSLKAWKGSAESYRHRKDGSANAGELAKRDMGITEKQKSLII